MIFSFSPSIFIYSGLLAVPLLSPLINKYAPHDFARLIEVAIMCGCAAALVLKQKRLFKPNALGFFFSLFLITSSISIILSSHPIWACRDVALWIGLVCIAASLHTERSRVGAEMPWVIVLVSGLYSINLFLIAIAEISSAQHFPAIEALFFGYSNYRFFNHVQTVALPLLIGIAVYESDITLRRLAFLTSCSYWFWLLIAGGRATVVALIAGSLLVGVLFRRKAGTYLRAQVICSLIGTGMVACVWALVASGAVSVSQELVRSTNVANDGARYLLWRHAWETFLSNPFFGAGPMHLAVFSSAATTAAAHPHNIFLQLLAEYGIAGFISLVACFFLLFINIVKTAQSSQNQPQNTRGMGVAFVAAVFGIFVDGFFSGNFVMPAPGIWIATLMGWAAAWISNTNPEGGVFLQSVQQQTPLFEKISLVGSIVVVAFMVFVLVGAVIEFAEHEDYLKVALFNFPGAKITPRFWMHGWF